MSVDAFSLACNIMTVIDFSHKYYRAYRQIYENGKVDAAAQREADELAQAMTELHKCRQKVSPSIPKEDQLTRVANQCWQAANELKQELAKLDPAPSKSRFRKHLQTFKVTAMRNWRQDRLEELKKTLERCESTMQSVVLVEMHSSGRAQDAKLRQDFGDLDTRLQDFIDAVSKRELQISQLFAENRSLHQETQAVVRQQLATLEQARFSNAELQRFKGSLKFPGFNKRFNDLDKGHSNSYEWLLGKSLSSDMLQAESKQIPYCFRDAWDSTRGDFLEWLQKDTQSKLYWISGKPGAGKSTLMKFLSTQLRDDTSLMPKPYVVLHHFFWLGSSNTLSRQNDLEGLLSTMLHQMVEVDNSLNISLVARLWGKLGHIRCKESVTDWGLEDLESSAQAALTILSAKVTVYVLVDALDEHLPSARHDDLLDTIHKLERIPNVRLVVSNRREPIFEQHFEHCQQLRLEHLTALDIGQFAEDLLKRSLETKAWLLRRLVELVVERAEGVFLWARLAIDSVKRGLVAKDTDCQLLNRLEDMPTQLSDYLRNVWKRLGDDEKRYRTNAANVFQLLLCEAWEVDTTARVAVRSSKRRRGRNQYVVENPDFLSLSFALDPDDACSIIHNQQHLGTTALLEKSGRCQDMVLSHCVGLVEFTYQKKDEAFDGCFDIAAGFRDPNKRYRFIHRTARDFLCETLEGREILGTSDLGERSPRYRWLLAYLARSVAFREPGHSVETCLLIRNLDWRLWFLATLPSEPTGDHLTSEQCSSLLSLCHKVHHRFCGSLENPRFDNWTLICSGYQVRPFVFEAALFGYQDYINKWFEEQASSSTSLLSPIMADALLKTIIEGQLVTSVYNGIRATEPPGLNLSNVVGILHHSNLQSQLETYGDLGKRLPMSCWPPPPSDYPDLLFGVKRSAFRHLCSTTQTIMKSVIECIQLYWATNSEHQEVRFSIMTKSLEFLKKHSALEEDISGLVQVADVSSEVPHIGNPMTNRISRETTTPRVVLIMAVFSPLWAVQWAARNRAAYGGPNAKSDYVEDFVQSAVNNGQQVREARSKFIVTKIQDKLQSWDYVELGEVLPIPEDLQRSLLQPLAVPSPIVEVRDSQRKQFFERYEEVRSYPSAKRLRDQELDDALVSQGIWCSAAEGERFAAACNIRVPVPRSIPMDLDDIYDNPDRFMVPPAGSSDSDNDFSYLMMPPF